VAVVLLVRKEEGILLLDIVEKKKGVVGI